MIEMNIKAKPVTPFPLVKISIKVGGVYENGQGVAFEIPLFDKQVNAFLARNKGYPGLSYWVNPDGTYCGVATEDHPYHLIKVVSEPKPPVLNSLGPFTDGGIYKSRDGRTTMPLKIKMLPNGPVLVGKLVPIPGKHQNLSMTLFWNEKGYYCGNIAQGTFDPIPHSLRSLVIGEEE